MTDDVNNLTSSDEDAVNMEDTMHAIYGNGQSKGDLLKDISTLESDIKSAQQLVTDSNESRTSYSTTVSPEQSNERRKAIVFLKKDLEKKKSEYDRLSNKE